MPVTIYAAIRVNERVTAIFADQYGIPYCYMINNDDEIVRETRGEYIDEQNVHGTWLTISAYDPCHCYRRYVRDDVFEYRLNGKFITVKWSRF